VTVTNAGTAASPLLINITGQVSSPQILDLGSTDRLAYNGDIDTGQTLQIDTRTGSVQLDGSDRSPFLSPADLITVPASSSRQIRFVSALAGTGQMSVTCYPAYL
jgi:hypothetical protein